MRLKFLRGLEAVTSLIAVLRISSLALRTLQIFLISFVLPIGEFAQFSVLYASVMFFASLGSFEFYTAIEQRRGSRLYYFYDSLCLNLAPLLFVVSGILVYTITRQGFFVCIAVSVLCVSEFLVNEHARRLNFQLLFKAASSILFARNIISFFSVVLVVGFSDYSLDYFTVLLVMAVASFCYSVYLIVRSFNLVNFKYWLLVALFRGGAMFFLSQIAFRSFLFLDKLYLQFDESFLAYYSFALSISLGLLSVVDLIFFQINYPKLSRHDKKASVSRSMAVRSFLTTAIVLITILGSLSFLISLILGYLNGFLFVAGFQPAFVASLFSVFYYLSVALFYVLYVSKEAARIYQGRIIVAVAFGLVIGLGLNFVVAPLILMWSLCIFYGVFVIFRLHREKQNV